MSISVAGLLATIIAAPIAFTLELASLACGLNASVALNNGNIDDKEFRLIMSEVSNYHKMKDEIRIRTQKTYELIDEKTKNSLIQEGKNQAREDFIKKLDA